jgi:predicted nucleic acid-binding protein
MIVVDANVITYLVVKGQQTPLAEALADRDHVWVAPPLWRCELTSAVTTMVRAGALTDELARRAIVRGDELMQGNERSIDQLSAYDAAVRYNISAYDAQYIALAEKCKLKCVTSDGPLLKKVPGLTVALDQWHQL